MAAVAVVERSEGSKEAANIEARNCMTVRRGTAERVRDQEWVTARRRQARQVMRYGMSWSAANDVAARTLSASLRIDSQYIENTERKELTR